MKMMKSPEMREGPEAYERFDATMRVLLSVPHAEIVRRQAAYKKQAAKNPNRRGPKLKRKSPSRAPNV